MAAAADGTKLVGVDINQNIAVQAKERRHCLDWTGNIFFWSLKNLSNVAYLIDDYYSFVSVPFLVKLAILTEYDWPLDRFSIKVQTNFVNIFLTN